MKIFKAKVSYGLLIPIITVLAIQVFWISLHPPINTGKLIVIAILLATIAFILMMFLRTVYMISDEQLIVKTGFFSPKIIDIQSIKAVNKTNSPLASPAPSMDRIEITYGKFDSIIISPLDKEAFVSSLKRINNEILSNIG